MNYGGNGIRRKKKLLNSSATKFRTKFNIFFIKLLLVGAIAVVISGSCLIFGAAQGIIESAPDISSINVSPEGYATKIYDNNGEEIQTLATTGANRIYASLDQIPVYLQHAFVAIEDERFYKHNGIDLQGIMSFLYPMARCHRVPVQSHSSYLRIMYLMLTMNLLWRRLEERFRNNILLSS